MSFFGISHGLVNRPRLGTVLLRALREDTPNWPLWQLIVSALGAIAVVVLVIGLVLRPKHRLPE